MAIMYYETIAFDWKSRVVVDFNPRDYVFGEPDNPKCMVIDTRMRMLSKLSDLEKVGMDAAYRNYVAAFAELTNESPKCLPSQYSSCGFLPVGIEPEVFVDQLNMIRIVPGLVQLGLEYFLVSPLSPVSTAYKPMDKMASTHDVWVSKLEAAKVVHKPPHNITTLDLLEVILPL